MEPPSATCRIVDVQGRGTGPASTRSRRPRASDMVAAYLALPPENVTVNADFFWAAVSVRKSQSPTSRAEAALCAQRRRAGAAGQGFVADSARTTSWQRLLSYGALVERLAEAGLDKDGHVVAWRHNSQRRADDLRALHGRSQARSAARAGHGPRRHALRHQERQHRKWRSRSAHQDWLVAFRFQRAARVRDSILRRRTGRGRGQGSKGVSARPDRTRSHPRRAAEGKRLLGLWRESGGLPDRHRPSAQRRRTGHREGGLGQARSAERSRPWSRRSPQFRELCRSRHRSRGRREGQRHGAACRHRGRLRSDREPGSRSLSIRGSGGDGARGRSLERNLVQGRPSPAEQPRRLPGAQDQRGAARGRMSISCRAATMCTWAASANLACRRSPRRS